MSEQNVSVAWATNGGGSSVWACPDTPARFYSQVWGAVTMRFTTRSPGQGCVTCPVLYCTGILVQPWTVKEERISVMDRSVFRVVHEHSCEGLFSRVLGNLWYFWLRSLYKWLQSLTWDSTHYSSFIRRFLAQYCLKCHTTKSIFLADNDNRFSSLYSSQVKSSKVLLSILPHVQYIHTENWNCVTLRPLDIGFLVEFMAILIKKIAF